MKPGQGTDGEGGLDGGARVILEKAAVGRWPLRWSQGSPPPGTPARVQSPPSQWELDPLLPDRTGQTWWGCCC